MAHKTVARFVRVLNITEETLRYDWAPNAARVQSPHGAWGRWILAKARAAGLVTRHALAEAAHMQDRSLQKLVSFDAPRKIPRTTIAKLARALHTSERMVRTGWAAQAAT